MREKLRIYEEMRRWKIPTPNWLKPFAPVLVLGLFAAGALAQDAVPSPTPVGRRGVWEADMPAGTYIVRLNSITSISMHQYLVDGPVQVTEVNIGTTGSDLVRFYYIEPAVTSTPDGIGQGSLQVVAEHVQMAADRTGASDVWQKVVKNYPTTTHAHTIEYRLTSRDSLDRLFASVKKAWLEGSLEIFKP